MKYDDEPSKTRKRVLESDPTKLKVDDAEEKISICTSYQKMMLTCANIGYIV